MSGMIGAGPWPEQRSYLNRYAHCVPYRFKYEHRWCKIGMPAYSSWKPGKCRNIASTVSTQHTYTPLGFLTKSKSRKRKAWRSTGR
jgi:hypothetical protein